MGLQLLARACPQNIIKVIKYFSYWVNWSDVASSQSSAMGQNDPYRTSSVNKRNHIVRLQKLKSQITQVKTKIRKQLRSHI